MKILFISPLLPHSHGISGSLIIFRRIRFLVECGHEVGLISFFQDSDKEYISEIKPLLIDMELLPVPQIQHSKWQLANSFFSRVPPPFSYVRNITMFKRAGEMIERSHYHIAIAEFSAMGQYLYRNPWLPAVRRIVSCHECCATACAQAIRYYGWGFRGLIRRLMLNRIKRYEFPMYRNMDHIIVLTPQQRYELLKFAPNLRISVVPHGIDIDYYSKRNQDSYEKNILFIGYYPNESNRNAVLWFARTVWQELKKKYSDVKFYVVGRGVTQDIKHLARVDSRIIVTGEVPDIRPYLKKAMVFICPVRTGTGFRAKLLAAMASGVPIVSTALGAEGIPTSGGDTLFLADTPSQMLKSISLLLSDSELRKRIASNARKLVESRFKKLQGLNVLENLLYNVINYD